MFYVIWIIWILLLIFISLGTSKIWHHLIKNRNFNFFVFPGIVVHQLSVALLSVLTGAAVTHMSLRGEGNEHIVHTKSKIPFLGDVLIGFAPLFGCSLALWGALALLGHPINLGFSLPDSIQITGSGLEKFAKSLVEIIADTLRAIGRADFASWKTFVFLYLSITLSFAIAPAKKDLRITIIGFTVLALLFYIIDAVGARISGGAFIAKYISAYWKIMTYLLAVSIGFFFISLVSLGFCSLFGLVRSPSSSTRSKDQYS